MKLEPQRILLNGASGSGKTTILFEYLNGLIDKGVIDKRNVILISTTSLCDDQ